MTITPFFTGLPTAVPTDPALAGDTGAGGDGTGAAPFGDALAAALLATVPGAVAPQPEAGSGTAESAVAGTTTAAAPSVAAGDTTGSVLPMVQLGTAAAAAPGTTMPDQAAQPGPTVAGDAPATGTTTALPVALTGQASTNADADGGQQDRSDRPVAAPEALATHRTPETADASALSPVAAAALPKGVDKAVIQQVFPEVTRIVANTTPEQVARTGTQRITLTLQPEMLGEVRVTLTVKDGALQVRLAGNANDIAGSTAVHRALSSGIPELQRLLEHAGAADARVFVRDPAGVTQSSAPAPAPMQQGFASLTADAGRDGNSAWGRSSENAGQSGAGHSSARHSDSGPSRQWRQDQSAAVVPDLASATASPTRPVGQLDRTL